MDKIDELAREHAEAMRFRLEAQGAAYDAGVPFDPRKRTLAAADIANQLRDQIKPNARASAGVIALAEPSPTSEITGS